MIAQKNRFHGRKSVSKVKARPLHSRNFSVKIAYSKRSDYRVAVVVSRKIDKRAVARNKLRRRVFEFYRTEMQGSMRSADIVVYAKGPQSIDLSYQEIKKELLGVHSKDIQNQAQ